jgi:hypothetical protein
MITWFAAIALAGSVFALLYKANGSGLAVMFGKNGFTPSVGMHILVWGCLALAVVSALAFPIALGFVQQSYENSRPAQPQTRPLTDEEQKRQKYVVDGLSYAGEISLDRNDENGSTSSIKANLYAAASLLGQDDFWVRRGRLEYPDGRRTDFSVGVLFDSRSWKIGDDKRFESIRGSTGTLLENALRTTSIRDLVENHLWTICVGLASSEAADDPEKNEEYADNRAYHLCKALVNLDYVASTRVKGLGLGVALTEPSSETNYARQRAAIIIGVTPLEIMHAHDVCLAATKLIEVNGVRLDNYSRSESGYSVFENIGKGEYDGVANLIDSDDVTDLITPE